jgi:Tfp pilus assembly major pilin PilA
MKTNEDGFHVVELSVIVVVIVAIGLISLKVADDHHNKKTTVTTTAVVKPVAENSINSKADLKSASTTLSSVSQENSQTTSDLNQLKQSSN